MGIQKGIPVVYPAQPADSSGQVQYPLRQRGLARIHMGQNAHRQPGISSILHTHRILSPIASPAPLFRIALSYGPEPPGDPCIFFSIVQEKNIYVQ